MVLQELGSRNESEQNPQSRCGAIRGGIERSVVTTIGDDMPRWRNKSEVVSLKCLIRIGYMVTLPQTDVVEFNRGKSREDGFVSLVRNVLIRRNVLKNLVRM